MKRLNRKAARFSEYQRKVSFAETHETAMLRRVHRAFTFKGAFSPNTAAGIVGRYAHETGVSWHEALYELVMMAARPWKGRTEVWG
jgi:hypothetical protein